MWKIFWSFLCECCLSKNRRCHPRGRFFLGSCRGAVLLKAPIQGSWKGLKPLLRNTHECLHCEAQPSSLANVVHNLLRPWASWRGPWRAWGTRQSKLSPSCLSVPSGQKKDRPVSSEGRLSHPNVAHASIPTEMASLQGSPSGLNVHMDVPPREGMEEPTRGPRSTTAH